MSIFRLVLLLLEIVQTSLWMTQISGTSGPKRLILIWKWSTAEYVFQALLIFIFYFSPLQLVERLCFLSCILQNSLVIDTPRVRKQTRPFSATKDELAELSEGESDGDETKPKFRRNNERLNSYGRTECFRVEKNLLVYGWDDSDSLKMFIF